MKKSYIIVMCIILLSFVMGGYFYRYMPEMMASHWNSRGEVDGYVTRFWGTYMMPILASMLLAFLIMIPAIDPLSRNIEKFRNHYDTFVVVIISFLFYLYMLTIFWNLGRSFNFPSFMAPAFGVLLFFCGMLISHAKRNWTIGIRTAWTMSSDKVWDETHELAGKLFKLTGIIAALGVFFPSYAIIFVMVPLLISAVLSIAASYLIYQKSVHFRGWNVKEKKRAR